jgi:two-component system sensor kinase FixL
VPSERDASSHGRDAPGEAAINSHASLGPNGKSRATTASRYLVALAALGIAILLRYAFNDYLGASVPYLQFFPAIMLAAWFGGLGPGVVTTAISALVAMYWLLPPPGLAVSGAGNQLSLSAFAAIGLFISWLNHRLHAARQAQHLASAAATARSERLHAILDTTLDGIVVIDAQGHIESFNRGAQTLFGYPEEEVIGRNVSILMPEPDHARHDAYLQRYLMTGEARVIGVGREVAGRRRDGTVFPLQLSVNEMRIGGERKFTGILHDLTDRVRMEQRLREQEALARLGEMAAVIAHEVKNPLAGIRGAIQVFGGRMVQEGSNTQILTEIVARIDALDQMMKDLLLFARPPRPRRMPIEIVPLVKTTVSLLTADPALRDVDIAVEGTAPPVPADADMLKVVFQNLLINSAHAMQGRGRIRVAVEPVDTTCQIAFVDGGPGIPADIREKVFTPFFTTKSRGTGLGLPTVKRLVEAHDGQISIDCPADGGTTVRIRLPIGTS